jgi:hypothetical protein
MAKHAQSIEMKMLKRIRSRGAGTVFTPRHFLDLGTRAAVDKVLSRLAKDGVIRKIARGIYDLPKDHKTFGRLHPSPDTIVQAIAKRDKIKVLPGGALAANMLGLSDQVPMRMVYYTDGPARRFKVGNLNITFRRTTPRNMALTGTSALLFQALRHLGRRNVSPEMVRRAYMKLTPAQQTRLQKDLPHAPAWIAEVIARAADGLSMTKL